MLKAVLFDLDGTLLPMDQATFMKDYFGRLMRRLAPLGYTPEGFLAAMKAGIAAMVTNNGSRTNEEAYWDAYTAVSGKEILNHMSVFEDFYEHEFDEVAAVCGFNPKAAELVHGELSPVGLCFAKAVETPPEIDLYDPDKSHPSYAGSCVAALCHYKTVFGEMPADLSALKLDGEAVAKLVAIVDEVVQVGKEIES